MSLHWEQSYILYVKYGYEIPLDGNQMPNPVEWTRSDRAKGSVTDYHDVAVDEHTIHRFSQSTMTWYSAARAAYVSRTPVDDSKKIKVAEKPASLEPILINRRDDNSITFSSIENFFQ